MLGAAHHSGAIPMCREAELNDAEIANLCSQIIPSEQHEIEQTMGILRRLQPRSSLLGKAAARVLGDGICPRVVHSRPGHAHGPGHSKCASVAKAA